MMEEKEDESKTRVEEEISSGESESEEDGGGTKGSMSSSDEEGEVEEEESEGSIQPVPSEEIKIQIAHDLTKKKRSADVTVEGEKSEIQFKDMNLSDEVLSGLEICGFRKPSPIQVQGIPVGKLGLDLLLQAKSGTGKTCVFSVVALESVSAGCLGIQALAVCHTREIALQISKVMKSIGVCKEGIKVKTFIGGMPIEKDSGRVRNCHIAIGTPGRLVHLIKDYEMDLSKVNVFILDEADKLLDGSFYADLKFIYDALPINKQVIASSATYPEDLDDFILRFMNTAVKIKLDSKTPVLIAVDQYTIDVKKVVNYQKQEGQSLSYSNTR